jgi:putative tryptophan/tyrosine transport system substrate-binding protein
MIDRKGVPVLLALFAAVTAVAAPAFAQQSKGIRVGVLLSGSPSQWSFVDNALVTGLREHGYVEGKNLTLVRRYGELQGDRIQAHAADLSAMKLDAIVTSCSATTRRAKAAAGDTPIVMGAVADPVGLGLVVSLARPGTNVTGRSSQTVELIPKRLEILHSILPEGARIAVLLNGANPDHESQWRAAEAPAQSLNLKLVRVEARGAAGLEAALASLGDSGARALLVLVDDPLMIEFRHRIVAAAAKLGLPSMYGYPQFAEEGGLMAYGADIVDNWRRSAAYVVKVANGAKPAELPIEQPTHFELVVNLKVAKELGITIPPAVLVRADRLIE